MRRALSAVCFAIVVMSGLAPVPAAAAATAPLEGLPRYDHVFVLVEENESVDSTYGPTGAPYLKQLAAQGVFDDHYYATGHLSLGNYIAMLNGEPDTPSTGSDCFNQSLYVCAQVQLAFSGGRNLADQLTDKGVGWKGYMDGTSKPCVHGPYDSNPATFATTDPFQGHGNAPNTAGAGPDYADRHNPFLWFPDIVGDSSPTGVCATHVRPFTELATDIVGGTVPQFGFITPDTCHDGHDTPCSGGGPGGLVSMNTWLSQNAPSLISYLNSHNGLLLLTTDEGSNSDVSGCCTGGAGASQTHVGTMGFGGRVGLVALGPGVKAGQKISTPYDHASLLRTIESLFGISEHLNNADTATAMTDLFGSSTSAASPTPGTGSNGGSNNGSNGGGGGLPLTAIAGSPVGRLLALLLVAMLGVGAGLRLAKVGRDR